MFTIPTIVTTDDINQRSYIIFYFNGNRVREYNGKKIGIRLSPNTVNSLKQRDELLEKLRFEFHKALEAGTYPIEKTSMTNNSLSTVTTLLSPTVDTKFQTAIFLLFKAIKSKMRSDLSKKYKRNLKSVYRQFKRYMSLEELNGSITSIPVARIDLFLSQFKSSGTYYMNKRRDLGVLFSAAGRIIDQKIETVQVSQRKKSKAKLHKTYDKDQLKPILKYLKGRHANLYLCCLLTYSTWLRPHEEIRLLTKDNFKNDYNEIHLSGEENKGGRVRVVYVPDYVRCEIEPLLSRIGRKDNIFTSEPKPFNDSYFNTAWTRAWDAMFDLGLIYEDQTIYSFRHTAAVDLYRRTKDVYLLQRLLGHSTIVVTLKYLRNLGEVNSIEMKEAAPQL